MKKIWVIGLISVVFLMTLNIEVEASSGKLKSASICTGSNGVTYGQHSSDNHWHVAVKHDSGWYPDGSPIYSNPCVSNVEANSQEIVETNNDSSQTEDTSNSVEETNSNSSQTEDTSNSSEKTNTKPTISSKNKVTISSKDLTQDLEKLDIINYLNVKVKDEEEGNIPSEDITVIPSSIKKDDYGKHSIEISYKDSKGLSAVKEATIVIEEYKNTLPEITYKQDLLEHGILTIYDYEIPDNLKELVNLLKLKITDKEDKDIKVTEDMISIDKENKIITINAEDNDGGKSSVEIPYEVIETSSFIGFVTLLIIVILIVVIVRRKKK